MSVHKKRGGGWQVNYRDEQGKLRSEYFPKGKRGKAEAEAFDLEIKLKKARKQPLPKARRDGIHLDELTQEWLEYKKAQGRSRQWLRDWANIFNKYLVLLCKKPVHQLSQADILAVIGAHWGESSQSTRNRYVGYIKATLQYGVEQGHLGTNPLASWKKGKELRRKSPLTLHDLGRIKAHAARKGSRCHHLAWALEVAWRIPARPGKDLYGLRFDRHVAWDKGGINLYHSKVSAWAFVRLEDAFMWQLRAKGRQHTSGHLIEYKGRPVQRLDTSLANCAQHPEQGLGLPYRPTMYDVRHLWITTALDNGLEPSAIAYLAGTSIDMIHANYYEPHQAEAGRALEIMPGLEESSQNGKLLKLKNQG
jgi:hypothetical protein